MLRTLYLLLACLSVASPTTPHQPQLSSPTTPPQLQLSSPTTPPQLRQASCIRYCSLYHPDNPSCTNYCTEHRACAAHTCHSFCQEHDSICQGTCASFREELACERECTGSGAVLDVVVWDGLPNVNVSITLPEQVHSHVVLLEQEGGSGGPVLLHDAALERETTFFGLYPWRTYSIRAVLLTTNTCCATAVAWSGSVDYTKLGEGDRTWFYPYPLPDSWIDPKESGLVSKTVFPFPFFPLYNSSSGSWSDYGESTSPWFLQPIQSKNLKVKSSHGNFKGCHENRGKKQLKCVYKFGIDYSFSLTTAPIKAYSATNGSALPPFVLKPRTICRFFPNQVPLEPAPTVHTLCVNTNTSSNTITTEIKTDKLSIKGCKRNTTEFGELDTDCCSDGGLSCVLDTISETLTLLRNSSYLLYLLHDPDKQGPLSTCKLEKPCDGYFQRVIPTELQECTPVVPFPVVLVTLSILIPLLLLAAAAVFVLWRRLRKTEEKVKKQEYIPSEEDALLGGELPREAISKERYIDRGNFGYIFAGKLKVRLSGAEGLTKQYDVAMKILKTDVGETNYDSTSAQDNVKEAKRAMKAEIHMMRQVQRGRPIHENVLRMYGYVVDAPPYILVLELCVTSLSRFLRQMRVVIDNQTLSPEELQEGTCLSADDHIRDPDHVVKTRLAPPRTRVLSRNMGNNVSSYLDSVQGRMTKQQPSIDKYQNLTLTRADLINYCWQVAKGMDFLHSIDLLHRDLAADNILLKEETNGDITLKICDFGQSRLLYGGEYVESGDTVTERQRMVRLRWTAPEAKRDGSKWSKGSDVWSYGVVMWEVFTLGGHPYPGWPDHHVIDNLVAGLRMKQPPCCSEPVWQIVLKCWEGAPESRGQFYEMKFELDRLMSEEKDKDLGVSKSDYIECDTPLAIESEGEDEVDIEIGAVEEGGGALGIGDFEECTDSNTCHKQLEYSNSFHDRSTLILTNGCADGVTVKSVHLNIESDRIAYE